MNDTDIQEPKHKSNSIGLNDLPNLGGKPKTIGLNDLPDIKKKEPSSQTSPASPSASLDTPTQTEPPTSPSESKLPSLYDNIFGGKGSQEQSEKVGSLMTHPDVNLVADEKGSLVDFAEKKYLQKPKITDEEKAQIHAQKVSFTNNYLDGKLTGKDVSFLHGAISPGVADWQHGLTDDQIAAAINNKTEFLRFAGNAPLEKGIKSYLDQHKKIDDQIRQLKGSMYAGNSDPAKTQSQISQLENQQASLKRSLTRQYDSEIQRLIPKALSELKNTNYGSKSWGEILDNSQVETDQKVAITPQEQKKLPKAQGQEFGEATPAPTSVFTAGIIKYAKGTHTLTPESTAAVLKWADSYLDKQNNNVINASVSGDIETKKRNYQEFGSSLVNYLNTTVPVEHNNDKFLQDFAKKNPISKAYIDHVDEIKKGLSGENYKAADSYASSWQDKQLVINKEKYWGESGLMHTNQKAVEIQHKYAQHVADGTMTKDVAIKQMQAEIQQDPTLKQISKNEDKEVDDIRNKTVALRRDYLTNVLSKVDPNLVVYNNGNWGFKGLSESKSKALIDEMNNGLTKTTAETLHTQNTALKQTAEQKAKRMGAFEASLNESVTDIAGAFYKALFDKTGYGGDDLRMYQGEKQAGIPLSQTDEAKKWEWKGLPSLLDYKYYLSSAGRLAPIMAGGAVIAALTEGTGLPQYAEFIATAGLFTAQDGLMTYEQLSNSTDKFGNKLTEMDAAKGASNVAQSTFFPNLAMTSVNLGALSRAKNISKPSLGKMLLGVPVNAALGGAPMGASSYLSYAAQQEAAGKKADFWDYAQDGNFTKSLIDGIIGGGILGLAHLPSHYLKINQNWHKLIYNSDGEFHENSMYNVAMSHAISGLGEPFRDATVLHLSTENWKGREAEKADLEKTEKYSVNLDRTLKAMKIDPKEASVNELYQAHNLALADTMDYFAENTKGNKGLAELYSAKGKLYREQAQNSFEGKAKFHYLIDANNKPIFISDQSFQELDKQGKIKQYMEDGTIKEVVKNDDPEFAGKYKQQNDIKALPPFKPNLSDENVSFIAEVLKISKQDFSELGHLTIGNHLDNADNHETIANDLIAQAVEHPRITQDIIGKNAYNLLKPIIEEQKDISSQSKIENDEKTERAKEAPQAKNVVNKEGAEEPLGGSAPSTENIEYKKNIRDDYFAKADFFTPEEKEKFKTLDEEGQNKMIDDKRDELSNKENEPTSVVKTEAGDNKKDAVISDKDKGVTEKTPEEKINEINESRKNELDEAHKPDVSLDFVSARDLVKSKDPILSRKQYTEIVRQQRKLKLLIDCLWK